jgi:hypothetical protein
MSSWRSAFLFPGHQDPLTPDRGILALLRNNFHSARSIRLCVLYDDQGHLIDTGDEVDLGADPDSKLVLTAAQGEQFSVEFSLGAMPVSCQIKTRSANPHIAIAWPNRQFERAEPSAQNQFLRAIGDCANDSQATFVLFVDDAPSEFEDRFVCLDHEWSLDTSINHKYGHGIREIWIHVSYQGQHIHEHVSGEIFERVHGSYNRYSIEE